MNVWMSLIVFLCYFSYVFCCSLIWVMWGNVMDWHAEGVGMEYVQISIAYLHIPIYIILPTIFMLKSKISRLLIGLDVSEMRGRTHDASSRVARIYPRESTQLISI